MQKNDATKNWRRYVLVLCLLTLSVNTAFLGWKKEKLDAKQFILGIEDFFRISGQNTDLALATYATEDCLDKLDICEQKLFPVSGGDQGWHYFFSTSVYTTAPVAGDACLVMFYSPFCDTSLMTLWQLEEGKLGITEAEIFIGDFIRQQGKPPFDTTARWLRNDDEIPLLGLVCSVNETLAAFQTIYGKSSVKEQKKWAGKLSATKDPTAMELNYSLAGAFFENTFISLETLFADAACDAVEKELETTLDALIAGKTAEVLKKAENTNQDIALWLAKISPDEWGNMAATAFLDSPAYSMVFFSPVNNGNQLGCFVFAKQKNSVGLKRIDYVNLKQAYTNRRLFTAEN